METKNKTKEMSGATIEKNKGEQYHFAGSGIYKPCVVTAETLQEAEVEYEKVRELIN